MCQIAVGGLEQQNFLVARSQTRTFYRVKWTRMVRSIMWSWNSDLSLKREVIEMSDVVAVLRPDCPCVPDDAQWNEMYQTELLCGKEGESRVACE